MIRDTLMHEGRFRVYDIRMASLTIQLPQDVKTLAESRAAEAGCASVDEYLAQLVRGEAASAPEALVVDTDEQLEALLLRRLDGPSVEMDGGDFDRSRERLREQIDPASGHAS